MGIVTVYCEAVDCKHNDGNCTLDFITIDMNFECSGFESKNK